MKSSSPSTNRASTTVETRPRPEGARAQASAELRARLIEAALVEFADHGFAGASTRAIARRAGAHQPQINYHFASKEELWKAVLGQLLGELDESIRVEPEMSPRETMETVIRGLVAMAAARPELNRIMIHEGTHPSERLEWLVETQIRPRSRAMFSAWDELVASGDAADIPPDLLYHLLVGAASLLHANAPEARLLLGIEPTDPVVVEAHADALVAMFLPERPPKKGRP